MRHDKALAKELDRILDELHDETASDDPFEWSDTDNARRRRREDLDGLRDRLSSFVYVSRASTVAKLLGFGTALPLAVAALLLVAGLGPVGAVVGAVLGIIAVVCAIAAAVVGSSPSIGDHISLAMYAIPRGWSFSGRDGEHVWTLLRRRFSFFSRGDESQSITTRLWGHVDEEKRRPFMMFIFYWVEVHRTTTYNPATKSVETKEQRISYERHGMFVGMPESAARLRITETGGAEELDKSIRLEFSALNKAVDIYCRSSDELSARKFLSPAVQEIVLGLSRDLGGMHLDFYPGFVLFASESDFLDDAPGIRLDREAPGFAAQIQPWIDGVEGFRHRVDEGLRRIAKYND